MPCADIDSAKGSAKGSHGIVTELVLGGPRELPLREGEAPAEPKVSFPCSAKPVARAFLLGPVP